LYGKVVIIFKSLELSVLIQIFIILHIMRPDYPHKLFSDHRCNFSLLMETLAMDSRFWNLPILWDSL